MPEINGQPVEVGDTILVQTQVAKISSYNELADRFVYVLGEGNGTNSVEAHISNTNFRKIDLDGPVGLAHEQNAFLQEKLAEVNTIADPQEEDPETDRVRGEKGAKLPGGNGTPGAGSEESDSGDEITTAG
jgi:hypothetical protein